MSGAWLALVYTCGMLSGEPVCYAYPSAPYSTEAGCVDYKLRMVQGALRDAGKNPEFVMGDLIARCDFVKIGTAAL